MESSGEELLEEWPQVEAGPPTEKAPASDPPSSDPFVEATVSRGLGAWLKDATAGARALPGAIASVLP